MPKILAIALVAAVLVVVVAFLGDDELRRSLMARFNRDQAPEPSPAGT